MGWIIFIIYLVCALLYFVYDKASEEFPEGSKEKKMYTIYKYIPVFIIGIITVCFILYAIGWVWYYICGGFLIFEDQPFWDKVFCGFLSVALLVFVFGGIAILMGWDKNK